MENRSPSRPHQAARVRAARARLLGERAAAFVARVRDILCEPTRAQIVRALGAGPMSVGDLAAAVRRNRTVVSQHLRVLRDGGVVQATRRGRIAYYALTSDRVTESVTQTLDALADAAEV